MSNTNMFKAGDIFGSQYRILKRIGAGSFGTIYLAEH